MQELELYDIPNLYRELSKLVDNGTITKDARYDFQKTKEEYKNALVQFTSIIEELDVSIKALKEYKASINQKQQRLEGRKELLKDMIKEGLHDLKLKKIKTPLISASLRKNPPKVIVMNEDLIAEKYYIPVKPRIDKKKILKDYKATGLEPSGCTIEQGEGVIIK